MDPIATEPAAAAANWQGSITPVVADRYRTILHGMSQAFCLIEVLFDEHDAAVDYRFLEVNAAFAQQSALGNPVGRTMRALAPQHEAHWFERYGEVVRTGQPAHFEQRAQYIGDYWYEIYALPTGPPGGGQVAVLFTDITARHHTAEALRDSQDRQAFLLRLADALRPLAAPLAIADAACRLLAGQLGAHRAQYALVEGGPGGGPARGAALASYPGPLAALLRANETLVLADTARDPRLTPAQRAALLAGAAPALVAVPLVKAGRFVAVLAVHAAAPRPWATHEVRLVEEVAERIWAAAERARAEAALAASEEKYRTLFNAIDEGVASIELLFDEQGHAADFRWLATNRAVRKMAGLAPEVVGKKDSEVRAQREPFWLQTYSQVAKTGDSVRFEYGAAALAGRVWDVYAARVGGAESREVVVVYNDITERKRREANLAFLADASEAFMRLTGIAETMHALSEMLAAYLGLSACAFAELFESAQVGVIEHGWHRADVPSPLGTYRMEDFVAPEVLRRCQAGEAVVVRDVLADPLTDGPQYAALGIGSFVSMPLVRGGEWRFLLVVYRAEPYDWRADEIELLRELTARVWMRLERARAEEGLRRLEEQFRLFVTTSSDVVYQMSADWQQMLHLSGKSFLADTTAPRATWLDTYILPDDRALVGAAIRAAVAGRQFFELEHRVFQADGSVGWTYSRAVPVFGPQGELTAWFGTATDITPRKLAEEALRESEQRLAEFNAALEQQVAARTHELRASRDLLHAIADSQAAFISAFRALRDEQGRVVDLEYIFVNSSVKRPDEQSPAVGQRLLEVFPEQQDGRYLDTYRAVIETGAGDDQEVFHDDGRGTGWLRNSATKLGDGVLVVGEDITARKLAEQERARSLQLLEQAEAVAQLGSWDYDLATGQFLWSAGMYQLFGLPLGQPIRPSVYLDYVVDEDRAQAELLVHRLATAAGDSEQILRLRVGEQVKTVRVKVITVPSAEGQPVRVLGVDLDISELQRLEADNLRLRLSQQKALFEAVQEAEEEERRRISESLHNGIGQLLYATKLQLDRLPAAPEPAPRHEAARLLGEAIRQLRALSHELTPALLEEFGLEATLQGICRTLSQPGLHWHCHLVFEEAPALPLPLQLAVYRLAQELAQNVVKHAQASRATLETEVLPAWVVLRVEDNGRGFDPTHTSDGLGLRSLRSRVALLGGRVKLTAAPGQGTQCQIRLPLTPKLL